MTTDIGTSCSKGRQLRTHPRLSMLPAANKDPLAVRGGREGRGGAYKRIAVAMSAWIINPVTRCSTTPSHTSFPSTTRLLASELRCAMDGTVDATSH